MGKKTYTAKIIIMNRLGLHARPASLFATLASKYEADIFLIKEKDEVNGKSILEVLTLASPQGTSLKIRGEGVDAEQAVEALKSLVESCFGDID